MKRSLSQQVREFTRLEELSEQTTWVHRRHPAVKLLGTLIYLVCLVSFEPWKLGALAPMVLYPAVVLAMGEVPLMMLLRRSLVALPFCLFAGISNVIFDRTVILYCGVLPVTEGLVSCLSIAAKTFLCVGAVLLLVAVTPMTDLTEQLRRMHVPAILVSLFEMTYRYAGTLLEEAGTMSIAYELRAPGRRGLEMGHMGAFVGSLLLKSYDRAQRVQTAMELRGWGGGWNLREKRPMDGGDLIYLLLVGGSSVLFRLVNFPELLGRWFVCWM